jgi:peptidoglycan/xylan/chitin deacetylase (PgdA/CDA1 family)
VKKPAELLVFWDYDTQWGCDRSRLSEKRAPWGHLEFEHTERLLELHARHAVPACFAVVGAVALPGDRPYHDPPQIRRIHGAGHEVASHSFKHEWLPGLTVGLLRETLTRSREALEQCIGASVRTFVPPFNQPFDHPRGWSFSLSERRKAAGTRNDLSRVCQTLEECGYRFCRVAYRPIGTRLAEWASGRRLDRPARLEKIAGITCVRLNTPCGFGPGTEKVLDRCVSRGGLIVVYGHPHSLGTEGFQGESFLAPFLSRVQRLQSEGLLRVRLPREMEIAA